MVGWLKKPRLPACLRLPPSRLIVCPPRRLHRRREWRLFGGQPLAVSQQLPPPARPALPGWAPAPSRSHWAACSGEPLPCRLQDLLHGRCAGRAPNARARPAPRAKARQAVTAQSRRLPARAPGQRAPQPPPVPPLVRQLLRPLLLVAVAVLAMLPRLPPSRRHPDHPHLEHPPPRQHALQVLRASPAPAAAISSPSCATAQVGAARQSPPIRPPSLHPNPAAFCNPQHQKQRQPRAPLLASGSAPTASVRPAAAAQAPLHRRAP